ncbi:L,D-transpeptidase [Neptuniibacter caesariensis]|uniref:ErfK/YbiS/YcfS/YnhG protein n=1 Tax=Neptuniibacter caesariensis TaxID=207954 RepID=A0A7U8C0X8_NEPCE|nr:L,D-transpeptidase [Neptuniibacter caesariensis]EAR59493.1 ErfK/YbiS/YcfS/YnhG protein [Oceanospirillum sp. MED92] [Neptuniibacter caesariensis]
MLVLKVSVSEQTLTVFENERKVSVYSVSTALNGIGQRKNSGCTPLGKHYIRACIGANEPLNAVFVGRRFTGEIYNSSLAEAFPNRDWILTRILWLCGCEPGYNRLGDVDTMQRYIYIHGTPDSEPMGVPLSHGCVRMRNTDLLELFDQVTPGTEVTINE